MTEKHLGKIKSAEYGIVKDYPFLFGLQLQFSLGNGAGIGCGCVYTDNISKGCNWTTEKRQCEITKSVDTVHRFLKEAKINYVSELIGKPVEVTIEDNTFKGFRILTEVL